MGWGDPSEDGVRCYAPDGDLIGKIHLPEGCANLCFGGSEEGPAVHVRQHVGLRAVRERAGRDGAVTPRTTRTVRPMTVNSANNRQLI